MGRGGEFVQEEESSPANEGSEVPSDPVGQGGFPSGQVDIDGDESGGEVLEGAWEREVDPFVGDVAEGADGQDGTCQNEPADPLVGDGEEEGEGGGEEVKLELDLE